jgi:hypothetical protein
MGYLTHKYSNIILFTCYKQYVLVSEYVKMKQEEYKKAHQDNKVSIVNIISKKLDNDIEINGKKYENNFTIYEYKKNDKKYYSSLLLTEDELDVKREEPIISAFLINDTKNENIDITNIINSYLVNDGFIAFNKELKECYIKPHVNDYDSNDTYYIEYMPKSDFIIKKISNGIMTLDSSNAVTH